MHIASCPEPLGKNIILKCSFLFSVEMQRRDNQEDWAIEIKEEEDNRGFDQPRVSEGLRLQYHSLSLSLYK